LDNLRGSLLMVLAMAGFAIADMFIKLVADTIPIGEILIVIGFGGALVYGGFAYIGGQAPVNLALLRGASGLRALFEGFAALCMVTSLALVPLSLITMVLQATPLLVTLGAALVFGDPVGWRRWSAIIAGLVGVLIVLRPFGETFDFAIIFVVVGVVAMSARDLTTRRVLRTISTVQLSTVGFLAVVPGGFLALWVTGDVLVWPDLRAATLLVCTVGISVPSLYWIIAAMRIGDIAFVAPMRYSRIVFGLAIGMLVFGETIDAMTLLGAAIIIGSGLYTLLREAHLQRTSIARQATL
jgi:drug/metabolite transporter (DMT)-like permease